MQTQADRDLSHLYQPFEVKFASAKANFQLWLNVHRPGFVCRMIEGLRSAAYQHLLWTQGRSRPGDKVTNRDGYKKPSNHQSGLAGDIGVFNVSGGYVPEDDEAYKYWGHCVRAEGLTWGGNFSSPIDQPHAEWPESDAETYTLAHRWLVTNGLS